MSSGLHKLDNPAWFALTETHARFADGATGLKRYDPSIVLFAGFDRSAEITSSDFDSVFNPGDSFFLFDQFPALPTNYKIEMLVECVQMVCEDFQPVEILENIVALDQNNWEEMYALINRVFPGYYLFKTPMMGDYFGIFRDHKLVAVAGERLSMQGLTEISAVVTDPEYGGRRYAQQLVSYLNEKNINNRIIPFLHTGSKNERAIQIYELLGYEKRRIINVTRIKRIG